MKFSSIILIVGILIFVLGGGFLIFTYLSYTNAVSAWGNDLATHNFWLHPQNPSVQMIKQIESYRGYKLAARLNNVNQEEVLVSLSKIKFSDVTQDFDFVLPQKIKTGEAIKFLVDISGNSIPQAIDTSIAGDLINASQVDIELQYALGHTQYEEITKLYLYY